MVCPNMAGPPVWSSGQRSWLQIQRSEFDSQRYQIFWEVMGLEWSPLSLVNTIEELLERKSNGSGLESREFGRRDPSHWPRGTLYPQELSLTLPRSGGRLVCIVRLQTQATEFFFLPTYGSDVSLTCRPPFTSRRFMVLIYVRDWVDSKTILWLVQNASFTKISFTSSYISSPDIIMIDSTKLSLSSFPSKSSYCRFSACCAYFSKYVNVILSTVHSMSFPHAQF
jgi:hypothetical protein